jgi:hypothetical protein
VLPRVWESKTCARGFAVSLAILFLAAAVLAQEPEKKAPVPTTPRTDCETDNCISKVLYLPEFSTASELQDVANTFRAILDFRNIEDINPSDHTITLKGSPEQFAAAGKILSVLESLRLSGGHDQSSVLVYYFKGHLSGTARAEQMLAQAPRAASTICDLSTCYIKVMYLPDLAMPELNDFTNKLRTTVDIMRAYMFQPRHVVVFEGTSEQVAIADQMFRNASAPQ